MEEDNYTKHFNKELDILRRNHDSDDELIIDKFESPIREIIEITKKQGHSGTSAHFYASYLSNAIKNILLFQPLGPITGEESEWVDVAEDVYQNNRCGAVFKNKETRKSHYLDAIVWQGEDEHDTFTGKVEEVRSRQNIKLPFIPKTFYVDVVKVYIDGKPKNESDYHNDKDGYYNYKIKDRKQLDKVAEYYNMEIKND